MDMEMWLPSDEGIIAKPYNSCRNAIDARFMKVDDWKLEGKEVASRNR